ncbi:MAG: restriction endonuclease subunit S [Selenomonas ruminantium]|uniref:Restriction endonuclease subunit S n=1 Tax=Selenomonas ruminantium TaxID=971 RepID=A0A927ZRE9_SELRU|nr:restriction endonuclease subunit S [Selenomonas ruminantium]MBE6086174.1 restriction endonuclease subunit S [Selenomonas ruminantium]
MNSISQYEEMKDSGIKWIGKVPAEWNIRRLYQIVTRVNNKNTELAEQNLLSLSYGKIKRKDINTKDGLLPASFDGYNIIEGGDIVLRLTDLQNDHTSLRVGHAMEKGIITSAYITIRPINPAHSDYLYYLIHSFDLKKGFYGMGSGVRQGLNYDEVKELRIVIPSQEEQNAIVAYLDDQCTQIDSLVQEAKETVEEYKKWRAAIIFEAVTKGLDKNVNMRNTRITWVGNSPSHWKISRIKNELDNLDYLREPISAENRENKLGLYDYYGASGIIDKIDSFNVDDTVLLIGEDGANLVMRNLPLVYRASGKFWVNNHAHILKVHEDNDYDFIAYLLEAGDYSIYITGTAQPKLSQSNLMRFQIVVPPLNEQKQIAAYLDEKCATIDEIIAEKEALIADLESYKKSLIYEAVTGKRKVVQS